MGGFGVRRVGCVFALFLGLPTVWPHPPCVVAHQWYLAKVQPAWNLPEWEIAVNPISSISLVSQVMHGGLFSTDDVTLEDIRKLDRNRQPPEEGKGLWISLRIMNFIISFYPSRYHVWLVMVGSTHVGKLLSLTSCDPHVVKLTILWLVLYNLTPCSLADLLVREELVFSLVPTLQNSFAAETG